MNEESNMFKSKHIKEAVGRAIDSIGYAIPSYERNLYENLLIEMHELTKMEMSNLEKRMIERMDRIIMGLDDGNKLCARIDVEPEPAPYKVIDLSGIAGKQVRVIYGENHYGFLHNIKTGSHPFDIGYGYTRSKIKFDPDYWVPNIRGENPWPRGVQFEIMLANKNQYMANDSWNFTNDSELQIIASRFVRLKEGWRMPTAEDYK